MTTIDDARAALNDAAQAKALRSALRALIAEHERTLEGLYAAYVNLGEDTDGARNAAELFGPMTKIGNPAEYVAGLVKSYRGDMEREIETLDDKIAALTAPPTDDERQALDKLAERIIIAFVQAQERWRKDTSRHQSETTIPAIVEVLRGFRRRGPITDEQVDAALAGADWHDTPYTRSAMRAALEAERAVENTAPPTSCALCVQSCTNACVQAARGE